MAVAPQLKIFNPAGEYVAACNEYEAAASLAAFYGAGARVQYAGWFARCNALWTEGTDGQAAESYDVAANLMRARKEALEFRKTNGMRGAEALAEQLRARSFVQTILAEDKVAECNEEAL